MDKQIAGLVKQNEAIYGSLKAKDVQGLGELAVVPEGLTLEEQKDFLLKENSRLKELVKASKPVEQVQPKPKTQAQAQPKLKSESKPKPKTESDDEEEEDLAPPPPKFSTIANMEDLKRAFFSGDNEQFDQLVRAAPYKFFRAEYKFASDKDGAPDYSARNLVKGFVRSFDDYRKYFMICFRCLQRSESPPTYTYPSIWIVNTLDPIENVIGSTAEDFDLVELTESDPEAINQLIQSIKKMDDSTPGFIAEAYVH